MLIKEKDPLDNAIQQLETIISREDVPQTIRAKAEQELRKLRAGERGEKEAAYYIDFHYKDSPNWAIIHDLRIKHKGRVAQIDHLLINRFLEFYVLESKTFMYGIKITEHGEFLIWYNKRYYAIPSPIEQNKRHILVLKALLTDKKLLPKRLGVSIPPRFKPYVLISPKARVIRPPKKKFDTSSVIKADEFFKQIQQETDAADPALILTSVAKLISSETLRTLASRLVKYHQPFTIDYYAKFGVSPSPQAEKATESTPTESSSSKPKSRYFCYRCHKPISKKVAMFCFQHKERFHGKAYCFDCQKLFPS